ncbi:MAG: glycine cleavage system aminomethyltransferase GcvT [Calditrichaeota bacterium]|nr:glycine cleavage system aminomethyltransferase GcvT [Calditrichota bacterium]
MKRIALHDHHVALGGRMVPFAGYEMPVQYSGIIDEHLSVRRNVGVFDVSHMGEFVVRGRDASNWLNRLTVNNVAALEFGQIQYSAMLYPDGGIVDDLLVYRFEGHFLVVVNAANIEKDFAHLESNLVPGIELINISDDITLLAIQGPQAAALVQQIADRPILDTVYYHFVEGEVNGRWAIFSRTGYTGEDGFEVYVRRSDSEVLWNALWEAGRPLGLKPIGLGARDSLRLEVCYCLYGNDIDPTTNPIEAGLGWITKTKKPGGFVGIETVLAAKEQLNRRLVGFTLKEKGIARHGQEIFLDGRKIGVVTSGGFSPVLDRAVGLAYIDKPFDVLGTAVKIDVRGRQIAAEVAETPFYKR